MDTKIGLIDVAVSLLGQEFTLQLWSIFICPLGVLTYLVHTGRQHSGQAAWMSLLTASIAVTLIGGARIVALKPAEPFFFLMIAASSALIPIVIASFFRTTHHHTGSFHPSKQR